MIYLNEFGFDDFVKKLKEQGKEFEEVSTKNNKYYSVEGKGKFYKGETNKGGFSRKELGLINSTKTQLKKFAPNLSQSYHKIDLFNAFSSKLKYSQVNKNCIQIDINSAYLSVLKNVGAINEKLYNSFFEVEDVKKMSENKKAFKQKNKDYKSRCGGILKVGKSCRLVSVGSVATQKNIKKYKGFDVVGTDFIYNESEANVFFYAAYLVGKVMEEILNTCEGWFFWVDCIFLPIEFAEKAMLIFENNKLEYHYNECEIEYKKYQFNVMFSVTSKLDGEIIEYFFRYGKSLGIRYDDKDVDLIMQYYEKIKEEKEPSLNDLAIAANLINLQVIDLIRIKDKFIALSIHSNKNMLLAISKALTKDITIVFPD